jgi:hypothetical protein
MDAAFSNAPTSERASKTMFGIMRRKLGVDYLIGQTIGARLGPDRCNEGRQRIVLGVSGRKRPLTSFPIFSRRASSLNAAAAAARQGYEPSRHRPSSVSSGGQPGTWRREAP